MAGPVVKIFGIPQSRTARCLWMARELGVPHENIPVHFKQARQTPDLMAVNPNARIPALEHGMVRLFESMAINHYLLRAFGAGQAIAPASLEEEAQVVQWSFWVVTELEKSLLPFLVHFGGWRALDEATLAQARTGCEQPFQVLEAHLSTRPWLLGDRFTAADLNVAAVMDWTRVGQVDLSGHPCIAAWLSRCLARPAFAGLTFRWPAAITA